MCTSTENLKRYTLIVLALLVCFFVPQTTSAQTQTPEAVLPIYQLIDGAVVQLDPLSGQRTTIATELTASDGTGIASATTQSNTRPVWTAAIDPSGQYVYVVEAVQQDSNGLPTVMDLVQINLATQVRTLVLTENVSNIAFSPDGRHAVITFFLGALGQTNRNACILTVQTLSCQRLNFGTLGVGNGYWLDNDQFLIQVGELDPLRIINVTSGSVTTVTLPEKWYIYLAVPIPSSNTLLISAGERFVTPVPPLVFLQYNLITATLVELPFGPGASYWTIIDLTLSPDGNHLFYGTDGQPYNVVDMNTGNLIASVDLVFTADWVSNEALIVQGSRDGSILEIMNIDATNGQIQSLAQGEAAGGILLGP
ncbi:MAG: hypothetical protein SF123_17270 [Chloroflexota bacterium]|nr:hypothetical protein [Chloroflexota bacterium]